MVVIDTSVWIDIFRNKISKKTEMLKRVLSSETEQIAMPAIIYVEILQGIREESEFALIKSILDDFKFIPMNSKDTFLKSVEIYRVCRKAGITIRNTCRLYDSFGNHRK